MSKIIPRWECRSFGSHFGDAEARLKTSNAVKLQHSDEIYLLSLPIFNILHYKLLNLLNKKILWHYNRNIGTIFIY